MTRKAMGIEAALRWAYRMELPKAERDTRTFAPAGFGASGAWSDGLTVVDNSFGVVKDFLAEGPPHPDALKIGEAVKRLDAYPVEMPEGWNPVADLGLTDEEAEAAIAAGLKVTLGEGGVPKRAMSVLVRHHGLMGGCPPWEADVPERRIVCGPNGKPRWFRTVPMDFETVSGERLTRDVERDGYDAKRHRPYSGAYRKTALDPDPSMAVASRAEYELWIVALAMLVDALEGVLEAHDIEPSARPIRPWETGDAGVPIVLRDLRTGAMAGWHHAKPLRFHVLSEREPETVTVLRRSKIASGRRRR